VEGVDAFRAYRDLYRDLAPSFIEDGARIHAVSLYAQEAEALEAFSLTGFGRIVMDAARPTEELIRGLGGTRPPAGYAARRAGASDAAALAGLDARLAAHIAASPVLMPHPQGRDEGKWREWSDGKDAVAFVAGAADGKLCGFLKAEAPQFDVSDAVHSDTTLAIDGMFVAPEARAIGVGRCLLAVLAEHARAQGKALVSVDCETTNLEAYAFWSRRFRPVAWSLERRV
jgi:GNAT superfamily N-acetyltransferase